MMGDAIVVENDIFGEDKNANLSSRGNLYKLQLRARHDPTAWALLTQRAKRYSHTPKVAWEIGGADSDEENRFRFPKRRNGGGGAHHHHHYYQSPHAGTRHGTHHNGGREHHTPYQTFSPHAAAGQSTHRHGQATPSRSLHNLRNHSQESLNQPQPVVAGSPNNAPSAVRSKSGTDHGLGAKRYIRKHQTSPGKPQTTHTAAAPVSPPAAAAAVVSPAAGPFSRKGGVPPFSSSSETLATAPSGGGVPPLVSFSSTDEESTVAAPVNRLIQYATDYCDRGPPRPNAALRDAMEGLRAGASGALAGARAVELAGLTSDLEGLAARLRGLREERRRQPDASPDIREVQMLVSVGMVAKKAVRRTGSFSTPSPTARAALHTLAETGVVASLADGLFDGVVLPSTAGGRAILAVAADAANDPVTAQALAQRCVARAPDVASVCRTVMDNIEEPPEARNDAARLVVGVAAADKSANDALLAADPEVVKSAERVRSVMLPLLVQSGVVRRKRRPTGVEETPLPGYSGARGSQDGLKDGLAQLHDGDRSAASGGNNLTFGFLDDEAVATGKVLASDIAAFDAALTAATAPDLPRGDVEQAAVDQANLLMQAVRVSRIRKFVEVDGHELLLRLMKQCEGNRDVVTVCLRAFAAAADLDPLMRDFCIEKVHPAVDPGTAASNRFCAEAYVALMADALVRKRTRQRAGVEAAVAAAPLENQLASFLALWQYQRHSDPLTFNDTVQFLRRLACDEAEEFTLKKAHQEIVATRLQRPLVLKHDRVLRRLFEFVLDTMELYCTHPVAAGSFQAQEIMYGSLCLQVLSRNGPGVGEGSPSTAALAAQGTGRSDFRRDDSEESAADAGGNGGSESPGRRWPSEKVELSNEEFMVARGVAPFLLRAMMGQPDAQVAQHLVLTACELCRPPFPRSMADALQRRQPGFAFRRALAAVPGAAANVTALVKRGIDATKGERQLVIEDLVRPRLDLVQRLAHSRRVFAGTQIMQHLLEIWGDVDAQFYGQPQRFTCVADLQRWSRRERRDSQLEHIGAALRKNLHRRGSHGGGTPVAAGAAGGDGGGATAAAARLRGESPGPRSPLQRRSSAVRVESPGPRSPLQRRSSAVRGLGVAVGAAARGRSPAPPAVPARASALQRRASQVNIPRTHSVTSIASDISSQGGAPGEDEWNDDWDENEMQLLADNGPLMIPPMVRTMRAVICGAFIELLKARQVPLQLAGLVCDRSTAPAALPDVLFLIGALAAVVELKDLFGQLGAIEIILDLVRRAYSHDGLYVAEIVANACLALASLVVMHSANTTRFRTHRGVDLVVSVLQRRGELNDAKGVNGASALICNLCFKNEPLKKLLGQKGACEALVGILASYKNTHKEVGSRCISSAFKAIGNLALNSGNMAAFINAEIHTAMASFLTEIDEELDDATLEACFRTLANLVIDRDNMEKFTSSVTPALSVLRRIQRDPAKSLDIYRWIFETVGNMCRSPRNAYLFVHNEGIETVFSILKHLPDDSVALHASAIYVLGVQTSNPENIPLLVSLGLVEFTVHVIRQYVIQCEDYVARGGDLNVASPSGSGGAASGIAASGGAAGSPAGGSPGGYPELGPPPSPQLPISALRCLRRVLVTEANAQHCLKVNGLSVLLQALYATPHRSMLAYEVLRIFFVLLHFSDEETKGRDLLPAAGVGGEGGEGRSNGLSPDSPPKPMGVARRMSMIGGRTAKVAQTANAMRLASMRPGALPGAPSPAAGGHALSPPGPGAAPARRNSLRQGTMLAFKTVLGRGKENANDGPRALQVSALVQAAAYAGYGDEDEPRDRVPLGDRAWQTVGLAEPEIARLVLVLRRILADDRVSRNLRLYRLALGLIAYFACEKVALDALYEAAPAKKDLATPPGGAAATPATQWTVQRRKSLIGIDAEGAGGASPAPGEGAAAGAGAGAARPIAKRNSILAFFAAAKKTDGDDDVGGDEDQLGRKRPQDTTATIHLIHHVLDSFSSDPYAVETALLLLVHLVLCANSMDEIESIADQFFLKELRRVATGSDDATCNALREGLAVYETMMKRGKDLSIEQLQPYWHFVDFTYPLDLSGWADDPYSDGPASLPADIKQFIRDGGKLTLYEVSGAAPPYKAEKLVFEWKATHDMLQLQWKTYRAKEAQENPSFPYAVPMSLFNGILPGTTNEAFAEVCRVQNIPISQCLGLVGPPMPDFADGITLNLRAGTLRERDSILGVLTVWRDSAAYGFR